MPDQDNAAADIGRPVGANTAGRIARVAIVGAGLVGATTAYALLLSGISAQIVIINRDKALAQADAH